MELERFQYEISVLGYVLFEDIVPLNMLKIFADDVTRRIAICREWQIRNGVEAGMEGAAHHIVGGDDSLSDFLAQIFLDKYIRAFFGSDYILNSYGAVNNPPYSSETYKHGQRFHRDVRTFSGNFKLMLNMLVMIDDFTLENGATKLVPGTHQVERRPSEEYLEKHSIRALGKAGSILLFDSNLWHAGAPNQTSARRMALTLTFTRPFFKQQMDYPRLLGEDFPKTEGLRQILGYNSRVPVSYDEWYQPPERRMYKPGQG